MIKTEIYKDLFGKIISSISIGINYNKKVCKLDFNFGTCHKKMAGNHVVLLNIIGNLKELINSPLIQIEYILNDDESSSYKFITQKGYVIFYWSGHLNGLYSEHCTFY